MMNIDYCPFCGSSAELVMKSTGKGDSGAITNSYSVRCKVCKVETRPYQSNILQNEKGEIEVRVNGAERAIETWNSRRGGKHEDLQIDIQTDI